ncbi:class I SAM-dependent methyltransferase [soil metagenome]
MPADNGESMTSFDALAPFYRWMEILTAGNKLQRCREAFLAEVPVPRQILIAGEGHGRSLVACRRQFPEAHITCLDSSPEMLIQARSNLQRHGLTEETVQFVQIDALSWSPPQGRYDLVITHFFLDCFRADQLEMLVPLLASATTPGASWLIADFQAAPAGWKRWRSRMILWMLYRFFRLTTHLPARELAPPDGHLKVAGFHLHQRREMEWGLLKSEWWQSSTKE